jgi:hypothetical protein
MGTRGRKSKSEIEVQVPASVEKLERPDAPYDLTDEQSEEWWAVVNRMPAEWFPRETHGMLSQYCRHVVSARRVAQLIEAATQIDPVDVDELDKLYKMQEREGRALSSLATRMRITQQATYDKSKKKPMTRKTPWQK